MRRFWTLPIAALALALVGFWGYTQYVSRVRWETRAETQYQRAFIDLTNNLGGLETQLAKASVGNSPRFLRSTLADIWRLSYAAQEKLGQLPIGTVELSRMKMLLAKVAAFAYRVTDRPSEEMRLSEEDWRTMQGFRSQARYVAGQLTSMQANIVQNNLRWVDVDRLTAGSLTAAAAYQRLGTNKLTKSLVMVENGLKRMPDPGFPESAVIFRPRPKALAGARKVTPEEGARIAARFVGGPGARINAKYLGRIRGEMPAFLYTVTPMGGRGAATRVGLTEQGGMVAWMLAERPVRERRQGFASAAEAAERFLRQKGFGEMALVSQEDLGTVNVVTMAPLIRGVLYYPEMVKCEVAMDNGQVIGYEGVPYLTFHDPNRSIGEARLSPAEVRKKVSPHLRIGKMRRAIVLNQDQREVLCYEVDGTMRGERFLVYLSAADGSEVKIRRVDQNGVEID